MCWGAASMLQHPVTFWVASSKVVLVGSITAEGQVSAAVSGAVAIVLHTSSQPCISKVAEDQLPAKLPAVLSSIQAKRKSGPA